MVFFKSDWALYTWLWNIHEHLKRDYDFLLIVVGDTGVGKSHFVLQLMETWYKVILNDKNFDESYIKNFNTDFKKWVSRYKELEPFQMNVFDEGSTALDSKDAISSLSKNLSKMFNVMRYKRIFSVVVLPDFFSLNRGFRENRLRGMVYVHKRGAYKLFTKNNCRFISAYNSKQTFKSLDGARQFHSCHFPEYKGVLLKPYEDMSFSGKDRIIDEVVYDIEGTNSSKRSLFDVYGKVACKLFKEGKKTRQVADKLKISVGSAHNIRLELHKRNMF